MLNAIAITKRFLLSISFTSRIFEYSFFECISEKIGKSTIYIGHISIKGIDTILR